MTATTFNPLAAARALKAAGIEAEHAEAIAGAVHQAAGADRADLATKGDIAALRKETKADLAALRWMFGFQSVLVLAMAAKLFGIV